MQQQQIIFERLDRTVHCRSDFDCGEESLNHYLSSQALQNQTKGSSVTHVAVEYNANVPKVIYGYYKLVNNCIAFENFPRALVKGLPKVYPISTIKIARLARNKIYNTKGFGGNLLIHALQKILELAQETGIYAIDVDLINDNAKQFYAKYGFVELLDNKRSMFLTLKSVKKLFKINCN